MFEKWLDRSILFSFDRSGFLRHQQRFPKEILNGNEKRALISGATKGIGLAAAQILSCYGTEVDILARHPGLNPLQKLDLGNIEAVYDFGQLNQTSYDILIHNAGSMPETKQESVSGYEDICLASDRSLCSNQRTNRKGKLQKNARVLFLLEECI